MKGILRHFAISLFSLYVISHAINGLVFENGIKSFLFTGAGLTIVSILAKPVINILLLPLNLVTFGLFRWVSSAIALFLVTVVVPDFKISGFDFPGAVIGGISIPGVNFVGFFAIVAFSFVLSTITSFVHWLMK